MKNKIRYLRFWGFDGEKYPGKFRHFWINLMRKIELIKTKDVPLVFQMYSTKWYARFLGQGRMKKIKTNKYCYYE
jgi:hypothetical protein